MYLYPETAWGSQSLTARRNACTGPTIPRGGHQAHVGLLGPICSHSGASPPAAFSCMPQKPEKGPRSSRSLSAVRLHLRRLIKRTWARWGRPCAILTRLRLPDLNDLQRSRRSTARIRRIPAPASTHDGLDPRLVTVIEGDRPGDPAAAAGPDPERSPPSAPSGSKANDREIIPAAANVQRSRKADLFGLICLSRKYRT